MIFSAFDVKFDETKNEIPPGACRPSNKQKKNNVDKVNPQKVEKNNVEKVDTQNVEKKQCRKGGFIYAYIPSYIPIYIKISNIRKMGSDIRPKNGHKWDPRGSPMASIWHTPSYRTPKGFFMPKGPQLQLK